MTPFAALQALCGLSNREAADYLGTRETYVEKLRRGARGNHAGPDYLARLHDLWSAIDDAAVTLADELAPRVIHHDGPIEIGYPADDAEADALGFPCVGAWRTMAARLIDELLLRVVSRDDELALLARIRFVPRGSTLATAAAADAHGA